MEMKVDASIYTIRFLSVMINMFGDFLSAPYLPTPYSPSLDPIQSKQQRMFSDEEDIFLVVLMHKFEYGNWERIRMEIRKVGRLVNR